MSQHFNNHLSEKEALAKWFAEDGEKLRLDYHINDSDIIMDIGGHHGDWAADIISHGNQQIWIFEPVSKHVAVLQERFANNPAVRILPVATGLNNRKVNINLNGTGSTIFGASSHQEEITEIDFSLFLEEENIRDVVLCKINIEGGEFDLLDNLIKQGKTGVFKNLQIQFHNIFPDAVERRNHIRENLQKTHRLTYDYPFVWENWTRID